MGSSLLSPPGLEEGIVSQMPSVLQWVPSLPNLAVLGALFLLIVIFRLACKGKSSRALEDEPPKVAGLPWIGSAVALGVGQASFLHKCRQKHGDTFTLEVLGKPMTFLHDPEDIRSFFGAPESLIGFQAAAEPWTARLFGVDSSEFFPKHHNVLHFLRKAFVPSELPGILRPMAKVALKNIEKQLLPAETLPRRLDLVAGTQTVLMHTGVVSIFGEAFAAEFLPRGLQRAFETFDANFELGASPLPHALQPRFLSARSRLLSFMREALARGLLEGSLALETVRQSGVSNKCWPNMLLTLLWASQANTAASLFWSVAFLLLPQHGRFLRRILEDVRDALGGEKQDRAAVGEGEGEEEEGGGGSVEACLEVISGQGVESVAEACVRVASDRGSYVHQCVAEALRLRAPGIAVRQAESDLTLECQNGRVMRVPGGRMLAIMPLELHLEERYFPGSPWEFNPDREHWGWGGNRKAMQTVPGPRGPGGVVFGGGAYRCPGRFFAEAELALHVLLVLCLCQISVPEPSSKNHREPHPSADPGWLGWRLGAGLPSHVRLAMHEGGADADGALDEGWVGESGDRNGALPKMDVSRLVGMKMPVGKWMVDVTRRASS